MANEILDQAVEYFAARSHNAWRRKFHKAQPDLKAKPRLRLRGGARVDINKPWKDLDPKAQADNRIAARDAYQAVIKHPDDREAAADYVHRRWIARNKADPSQPKALFKPYAALPEGEKDKDRAHVDAMKAALRAVNAKKPRPRKTVRRAPSIELGPAIHARLEAAAKRLSAQLGRQVTSDELARAAVEAMLTIYEAPPQVKRAPRRKR